MSSLRINLTIEMICNLDFYIVRNNGEKRQFAVKFPDIFYEMSVKDTSVASPPLRVKKSNFLYNDRL